MKPEEKQLLMEVATKVDNLTRAFSAFREEAVRFNFPSQQIIDKDLMVMGNLKTDVRSKLGFYGKTPASQPMGISAPSGGATVDSQSRTAITSIINALNSLGLTG